MTTKALMKFQRRLEEKQAELTQALGNREGLYLHTEGDELDHLQRATERELAISNLCRGSSLLRAVREALKRIADGTFGACVLCGKQIRLRRLEALPWTPYCVECQQAAEQEQQPEAGPDLFRLHAA